MQYRLLWCKYLTNLYKILLISASEPTKDTEEQRRWLRAEQKVQAEGAVGDCLVCLDTNKGVSVLYGVRVTGCSHTARTLCEAFCDRAGEQNYDERLAWDWLSENRAPVRIRTGAEGLNETDTTTEGANKNDDLAHTNSVTGSAFAIANNSWQNFYWLKADKNVAKTWRAVC